MRLLLDKVVPKMTLEAQLEKTYRNLHPSPYRFIFREQILGQREEVRREKEKTYRPPPAPEAALFPNFAYKVKKRTKVAITNTTDLEMENNVAARNGPYGALANANQFRRSNLIHSKRYCSSMLSQKSGP